MPPAIWFAYTPDRKGIHLQQPLKNFTGVLYFAAQMDGIQGGKAG